jgi:hypothetical protein
VRPGQHTLGLPAVPVMPAMHELALQPLAQSVVPRAPQPAGQPAPQPAEPQRPVTPPRERPADQSEQTIKQDIVEAECEVDI